MSDDNLPRLINHELEQLDRWRKAYLLLIPEARAAEQVVDMFPDMEFQLASYTAEIEMAILGQDNVDAVVPVLRALAKRGYSQTAEPYTDVSSRTRNWQCGNIKVRLYLFATGEDAACRFVEVGERTVPVFELQCGGTPVNGEGD